MVRGSTRRVVVLLAVGVACSACDDDPTAILDRLSLTACPTGPLDVNGAIPLRFSGPVVGASVTPGNVIVSDAATGTEIPGSLALSDGETSTVTFRPSRPLPFATPVRIRIQNLLDARTNEAIGVTVCEVMTAASPIGALLWARVRSFTGQSIAGASLVGRDSGFIMSSAGPLFRRQAGGDFVVAFSQPYYAQGYDVAFVDAAHGFATFGDARGLRSVVAATADGGATFDTIAAYPGQALFRTVFRAGGTSGGPFGIVAGGSSSNALFVRYDGATGRLTPQSIAGSGPVSDVAFAPDDRRGAAASVGFRIGSFFRAGRVFVTADGGASWSPIPDADANQTSVTYLGVAVRQNGEVFVAGGSGYVLRLQPTGTTYTVTRILRDAIANADSSNPDALIYTDVAFAPDDDRRGWLVGAQQVGVDNGVPRYEGLIFETRDGGTTWVRQGVRGAEADGAAFPRLNRIEARSTQDVWLVGDAGLVLTYAP